MSKYDLFDFDDDAYYGDEQEVDLERLEWYEYNDEDLYEDVDEDWNDWGDDEEEVNAEEDDDIVDWRDELDEE